MLRLSNEEVRQQFRRAVFNVIARNQDDHVKNIAFLMNRSGKWSLSPAFDVVYSFNPAGAWTSQHQMSINGKRDVFELADLIELASVGGIKKRKAIGIIEQVSTAVADWKTYSDSVEIPEDTASKIQNTFRLDLTPTRLN